jgi:hypothetical protein
MTKYIVHIYREMRLTFEGIEAETLEAAATIAHDKPTSDADGIDDCEGETLSALVDVAGDEEFENSRFIDFDGERKRKAASRLLAALEYLAEQADEDCPAEYRSRHFVDALEDGRNAVAEAKDAAIVPDSGEVDIHAILASRHQIAEVWSVEDVLSVRPGLTAEQSWDALQRVKRSFDAGIGINWEVLQIAADGVAGEGPGRDEPEEE